MSASDHEPCAVPRAAPRGVPHVRVTNPDRHGFVEFRFVLGDPDLALDMTLPPAAFAEFCAAHGIESALPAKDRA